MWFGNQNVPVERRVNPKTNATTPHRSASGWPVADAFTMANNRANESFGFDGDVDDFFAVSGTPTPSYETTVASSNTKHVRVIKRTNTNKGRTPKSTEEAKRFRSVPPPVRCACVRVRAWYPVSVSTIWLLVRQAWFSPTRGFPCLFFFDSLPQTPSTSAPDAVAVAWRLASRAPRCTSSPPGLRRLPPRPVATCPTTTR